MTDLFLSVLQLLEAFGTWIIRDPNAWWIFVLIIIGTIVVINIIKSKRF